MDAASDYVSVDGAHATDNNRLVPQARSRDIGGSTTSDAHRSSLRNLNIGPTEPCIFVLHSIGFSRLDVLVSLSQPFMTSARIVTQTPPLSHELGYWWLALACTVVAVGIDAAQRGSVLLDLAFGFCGLVLLGLSTRGYWSHARSITLHIIVGMAILAYATRFGPEEHLSPLELGVLHQAQSAFIVAGVLGVAIYGGKKGLALGLGVAALSLHHASSELMAFGLCAVLGLVGLVLNTSMARLTQSGANSEALALLDGLTGLPNRRAAERQFDTYRALGKRSTPEVSLTIMAWDLDRLKAVNDSEGHASGDRYIIEFCVALQRGLRKGELAFRIGGDEFLSFHLKLEDGDVVAKRVRMHFNSVSVGWAVESADGDTFDSLVRRADQQMYQDKASRRVASAKGS